MRARRRRRLPRTVTLRHRPLPPPTRAQGLASSAACSCLPSSTCCSSLRRPSSKFTGRRRPRCSSSAARPRSTCIGRPQRRCSGCRSLAASWAKALRRQRQKISGTRGVRSPRARPELRHSRRQRQSRRERSRRRHHRWSLRPHLLRQHCTRRTGRAWPVATRGETATRNSAAATALRSPRAPPASEASCRSAASSGA